MSNNLKNLDFQVEKLVDNLKIFKNKLKNLDYQLKIQVFLENIGLSNENLGLSTNNPGFSAKIQDF